MKSRSDNSITYIRLGALAQCPRDQMMNFCRAQLVLQPRQLAASAAARMCDQEDGPTQIGFGGARGGGKSFWLLAQMGADDCQRMPGLKCLLLRKVGKSNLENFQDLRRSVFRYLPHEFSSSRGLLTFPNGSRIIAGHYQHESDIDSYLGLEYDVIGVEEATTLTARKYSDISTCCRSTKMFPSSSSTENAPPHDAHSRPGGLSDSAVLQFQISNSKFPIPGFPNLKSEIENLECPTQQHAQSNTSVRPAFLSSGNLKSEIENLE